MGIVELIQTILVSGVAVTMATQFLKSRFVPIQFSRFPRLTALALSIVATAIAVWQQCGGTAESCQAYITGPVDYISAVLGSLLIATITYNNVVPTDKSRSKY